MRHFSVPSVRAQETIEKLRQNGWISNDYRIHPGSEENILIPLNFDAPDNIPDEFVGEIISTTPHLITRSKSWQEIFEEEVGGLGLSELDDGWARGHEIVGDVLIQPAQRFSGNIPQNIDSLIRAKMQAHPRIRVLAFDYGVQGEYRVRDLEIAAVRTDRIIVANELESLSSELLHTDTTIRESGLHIKLNPAKVYFSSKLETERLETIRILQDFKKELNRPLAICDPYCGVGPALVHICAQKDLSSTILANDLNPNCIPYIFKNIPPLQSIQPPKNIDGLMQITPKVLVGNMDAQKIPSDNAQLGQWDVLLVNLPHMSLNHLPSLIPLLKTETPSLVRGWSILPHDEVEDLPNRLISISGGRTTTQNIKIKVRKQYAPSHDMVGYWMRLCGAPTGI